MRRHNRRDWHLRFLLLGAILLGWPTSLHAILWQLQARSLPSSDSRWKQCIPKAEGVSVQVLESLRRAAEFPREKLAHFDSEGAEELLYEMRNLGVGLRAATAEYIADNDLDPFVRPRTPAALLCC